MLFSVQNAILDENIIGKLVLGYKGEESVDSEKSVITSGGRIMAADALNASFHPKNGSSIEKADDIISKDVDALTDKTYSLSNAWNNQIMKEGNFFVLTLFSQNITDGDIEYLIVVSTVVGVFLVYIIFSFCLDIALRVIKLSFYQIIAPIPALSLVIPGQKKIFDNWVKVTVSTFLEVFIRLLIIFMGIYLISKLSYAMSSMNFGSDANFMLVLIAKLLLIIGIVSFMRQAPKAICDMFGIDSGSMKIGIGEKLAAGGALVAGGMIGGGVTSAVRNFAGTPGGIVPKLLSGAAGFGSGAIRGGIANKGSKTVADMKKGTTSAIDAAAQKKADREFYKATHPGSSKPMFVDNLQKGVKQWATGAGGDAAVAAERKVYGDHKSLMDAMKEEAYKKDDTARQWNNQFKTLNETAINPDDYKKKVVQLDSKTGKSKTIERFDEEAYKAAVVNRDKQISAAKQARDNATNAFIANNATNEESKISYLASQHDALIERNASNEKLSEVVKLVGSTADQVKANEDAVNKAMIQLEREQAQKFGAGGGKSNG